VVGSGSGWRLALCPERLVDTLGEARPAEDESRVELHEVGPGVEEGQGIGRLGPASTGDHREVHPPARSDGAHCRQNRGVGGSTQHQAALRPGDAPVHHDAIHPGCDRHAEPPVQVTLAAVCRNPDNNRAATASRCYHDCRHVRRPGLVAPRGRRRLQGEKLSVRR
jgi:hypothetical protein